MKLFFILTIVGWFRPVKIGVEAGIVRGDSRELKILSALTFTSVNQPGISNLMTSLDRRSRRNRDSSAIVFLGPTNKKDDDDDDGVIHFPSDNHKIDGNKDHLVMMSLPPTKIEPNTPAPLTIIGAFANCGVFSVNGVLTTGMSSSGIFILPNGTQVAYSNCQIIHTIGSGR